MAIARQSFPVFPAHRANLTGQRRLILFAAALAALCGIAAFLFFILRDRSHVNVMVAEQVVGPAQHAKSAAVIPAASINKPPVTTSAPPAGTATPAPSDFSLPLSRHAQALGPIRARLLKTDATQSSYDLSVVLGRRSYSHHGIKLKQPLWIAINRSKSVEIVVNSIQKDSISGYWSESARSAQIESRKHKKH